MEGFGKPVDWVLGIVVPIFKGRGVIRNCSCYRTQKLLENGMKVVEMVLEKRLHRIVTVNERVNDNAVIILRRLKEEYHAKEEGCICVLWT